MKGEDGGKLNEDGKGEEEGKRKGWVDCGKENSVEKAKKRH